MARSPSVKKPRKETIRDFDFSDFMTAPEGPEDEMLLGMMQVLIEAYRHQQQTAIELTRLVVDSSSDKIKEEQIFSTFRRATQVVSEASPIQELFKKMQE